MSDIRRDLEREQEVVREIRGRYYDLKQTEQFIKNTMGLTADFVRDAIYYRIHPSCDYDDPMIEVGFGEGLNIDD